MLRSIFVCAFAVALSACALNDHFDGRVGRFDIAAQQARDTMILTNIVRASFGEPLSFVQLGKVSGANTATATMGLPSFMIGPHSTIAATALLQKDAVFGANPAGGNGFVGNSTSTSGSINFEVTPTETKDFYRGLLSEVDPHTLEFFVQQGIARELLFYIFVDRLINERPGKRVELRNDPLDPAFPAFQQAVHLAMDYGLATEPRPVKEHTTSEDKQLPKQPSLNKSSSWQLCFDKARMKSNVQFRGNSPICGSGVVSENDHTVSYIGADGKRVKLTALPRSIFGIFQYLGRIIAAKGAGDIELYSTEAIDHYPLADKSLFHVEREPQGPCFVSAEYHGANYCVPLEGATNTKRILALLTQLLALNTSVADIPITPTVRVIQ